VEDDYSSPKEKKGAISRLRDMGVGVKKEEKSLHKLFERRKASPHRGTAVDEKGRGRRSLVAAERGKEVALSSLVSEREGGVEGVWTEEVPVARHRRKRRDMHREKKEKQTLNSPKATMTRGAGESGERLPRKKTHPPQKLGEKKGTFAAEIGKKAYLSSLGREDGIQRGEKREKTSYSHEKKKTAFED